MKKYLDFIEYYYSNDIPKDTKITIPIQESFFGQKIMLDLFIENGNLKACDTVENSLNLGDFKKYIDDVIFNQHKDLSQVVIELHVFYADLYGHRDCSIKDFIYVSDKKQLFFDPWFF
ncbi:MULTISPECIES: hypothetical protein [Paenibacillus]|uniref:hypothetical protein n=1 Tax=Paenibacillus TaxID=44249 RepID=UPI000B85C035|nr:hypothetical protein [Paenibacillus amylolyticus]